ncbi:MAG: hypothetical protein ABIA04_16080 [Pseudomonadota bacterium]
MDINQLIDEYGKAVNNSNSSDVANLFNETFDHIVHGINDQKSPWDAKHKTSRQEIKKLYEDFFTKIDFMKAEYVDRIIDNDNRAIAMTVKAKGKQKDGIEFNMSNALHVFFNENGKIIKFHNWYGI